MKKKLLILSTLTIASIPLVAVAARSNTNINLNVKTTQLINIKKPIAPTKLLSTSKLKSDAKQELDNIYIPTQNNLHNPDLFLQINDIKTISKNNIDQANKALAINSIRAHAIAAINEAIREYMGSKSAVAVIQALSPTIFNSLSNVINLNLSITTHDVYVYIMEAITSMDQLSQSQLNIIHESDIELDNSIYATLIIIIKNHGHDKLFNISRFKLPISIQLHLLELIKLKSDAKQELDNIHIPTQSNLHNLNLFLQINDIKTISKNNIEQSNDASSINKAKTRAIVAINEAIREYMGSKSAVAVIQALLPTTFDSLSNSASLNASVTPRGVYTKLLQIINSNNRLSQSQLNTIHQGDIDLDYQTKGSLIITIKNHGPNKEFTVSGFKLSNTLSTLYDY